MRAIKIVKELRKRTLEDAYLGSYLIYIRPIGACLYVKQTFTTVFTLILIFVSKRTFSVCFALFYVVNNIQFIVWSSAQFILSVICVHSRERAIMDLSFTIGQSCTTHVKWRRQISCYWHSPPSSSTANHCTRKVQFPNLKLPRKVVPCSKKIPDTLQCY